MSSRLSTQDGSACRGGEGIQLMNIIKNRYLYFLISLLVIIPGLIFLGLNWRTQPDEGPLKLGIDFRGGSLLEVQFSGTRPAAQDVQAIYRQFATTEEAIGEPIIQPLGDDAYSIR